MKRANNKNKQDCPFMGISMKKNIFLYALVLFVLILIFLQIFGSLQQLFNWTTTITHIINSVFVIVAGLILGYLTSIIFKDAVIRKIIHYIIFVGAGVTIFFIFQENVIAVGISLGIIAVAFTFIFQAPILNLVGWVYITIGKVYREGDRIRVGNFKGDVVDINPMRTKIFEIGGEYTASDLPSGRIVTLPNSLLLSEKNCPQPPKRKTRNYPRKI